MGYRVYPRESVEYLQVPVESPGDIAGLTVEMQVRPYPERPLPDGWKEAGWGEDEAGQTVAQTLIGPGQPIDLSEAPGTYVPYVRISASPETPLIEGRPIKID